MCETIDRNTIRINRNIGIFFMTLIIAIFINGGFMNNELLNPDSIWLGEQYMSGYWEISLGRWGLPLLDMFHGGVNSYIMSSGISLMLFSISGIMLNNVLGVNRNSVIYMLFPIMLVTFPMISEILTYQYCAEAYALSFFLSILSVYLIYNKKNSFLSILCLSFSISLYQSNIGIAIVLVLWLLIKESYSKKFEIKDYFNWIIYIVVAVMLYYIIFLIIKNIFNIEGAVYKGADEIGVTNILKNIPYTLINAIKDFKDYFFDTNITINSFGMLNINKIYWILFFVIYLWTIIKRNMKSILLTSILLLCLPIGANTIDLLAPNTRIILLTSGGMCIMTFIAIKFIYDELDECQIIIHNIHIKDFVTVCICVLIIVSNIVIINADSTVMNMEKEKAITVAENVYEEFVDNSFDLKEGKVLVIGTPTMINGYNSPLKNKTNLYANWGLVWPDKEGSLNCWDGLYEYYLGIEMQFCSINEYLNILENPIYKQMPLYPEKGYVKEIEGIYVAKIANVE